VGEARFSMEAESENAPGYAHGGLGGFERRSVSRPVFLE
jgi:hypothetical protein